jgi:hypothetical protein
LAASFKVLFLSFIECHKFSHEIEMYDAMQVLPRKLELDKKWAVESAVVAVRVPWVISLAPERLPTTMSNAQIIKLNL